MEWTPAEATAEARYKKIVLNPEAIDRLRVDVFFEAHPEAPSEIVLDLDATDDPLHGNQEGRFLHGYYGHSCSLPLYIFCGEFWLCARLRPSNLEALAGCVEELERIVAQIRGAWPEGKIVIRGDAGFCREELRNWCEAQEVEYVLGLAKNARLQREIASEMAQAEQQFAATGQAARLFRDFRYQTRESWSRARRVVAQAEHLEKGSRPRLVVTSLESEAWPAQRW